MNNAVVHHSSVDLQGLRDVEQLLLEGPERGAVVRVRGPAEPHGLKISIRIRLIFAIFCHLTHSLEIVLSN